MHAHIHTHVTSRLRSKNKQDRNVVLVCPKFVKIKLKIYRLLLARYYIQKIQCALWNE